jgi:ABC-2 type transport system ATP-binding protein
MTVEQAAIVIKGIKKAYKNVQVLNDVNFTVQKGSIFALLGANGAGKTTIINILTTLLKADAGSAQINGYDIDGQGDKVREQISLTGQFAAVDNILTGREKLIMIAELRYMAQPEQATDKLLDTFDLQRAADRPVSTYSGGMRRRLDIAMSLIDNLPAVFLDEPTISLDPQSRNAMWQIIRNLAKSGTTVFLTTQYLEEADQLADHIAILKDEKIIAQGTPAELKKLLPGGRINLNFSDEPAMQTALQLFKSYENCADTIQLSLSVTTDGSVEHMAGILINLKRNHIKIAEISQKSPTLDDVFLGITGDMSKWPTVKHFTSWLCLAPHNDQSASRTLRNHVPRTQNRAHLAFRHAALSLKRSTTALGHFFGGIEACRGTAVAVVATAHELARIVYFIK